MKLFLATYCLVTVSMVFSFHLEYDLNLEEQWSSFKHTYGRKFYSNQEEMKRKEIFRTNLRDIAVHNMKYSRGLETFTRDVNHFSDMTMEEFRASMLTLRVPENHQRNGSTFLTPLSLSDLPTEVDWRTKGFVTRVKDQAQCGSCWAFSATGSIEGQQARKTGNLVSLSEQNLVDCSSEFGNEGCNGGLMDYAFEYIIKNGGIDTEESYPYVASDNPCTFKKDSIGATITGFVDLEKGNEKKLLEAVATVGPVSVGIDADHTFHSYKSGIYYDSHCSSRLNHGVLVVGYGTEDGMDYWLVKNSWGIGWGDKGYIKMARNRNNHCGIASLASYPTV